MDEVEARVRADIAEHGWHVVQIPGDEHSPPWAHSIGLLERFEHPEILAFGLDLELLHRLINQVGLLVKRGTRIAAGEEHAGILEDHRCAFREIAGAWYGPFLGNAAWFHGRQTFPALQCFWPDPTARFPWQEGFDARWRDLQPLLYEPEEALALPASLARVLREEGAIE